MTEPQPNIGQEKVKLIQWLLNPFKFIAGYIALSLGLAIVLVSALLGWLGKTHFDGVLDVHIGSQAPLWFFVSEGLTNWLCLAIPLLLFGMVFSKSTPRIIDVFGTQALARWPYLITAIASLPEANTKVSQQLISLAVGTNQAPSIDYLDMVVFVGAMVIMILMAVWMVALMYKAYSVSCNLKGTKAVLTFIASLISAEVASKVVILSLAS
jgi:hypothetical protein